MEKELYYQRCLKENLVEKTRVNPRYSLRAFSKYLEVNPSTLSRVLKGEKRLSIALSKKILGKLELGPKEVKEFLSSVAESYKDEGTKRRSLEVKALLEATPLKEAERDLTPEVFKIISDWYHYGILQLVETHNFKEDVHWISRQLGITEIEADLAIKRLLELEMLVKKKGKLVRSVMKLNAGDPKVTTTAHRKRIRQITEKSIESLENDSINIRNHTTMTMAIDPDKIPLAKEMIDEFMDRLSSVLQTNKKNVYELQINLFPLQRTMK